MAIVDKMCPAGRQALFCFCLSFVVFTLSFFSGRSLGHTTELWAVNYWGPALYLCLFAFILRYMYKGFVYEVSIRAAFLGAVFACGLFLSTLADGLAVLGRYLMVLSFFHFSEFMAVAMTNPKTLTVDSFILNHSKQYWAAAVTSWLEFTVEYYFFPRMKTLFWLSSLGMALCVAGELMRKGAMFTAKTNFNHTVQYVRRPDHELVTHGLYSICRHPSYVGWFYWSIGTQITLLNPICIVIYTAASWVFFRERVYAEELTLLDFFGRSYEQYQRRVRTGLPFIKGCVPENTGNTVNQTLEAASQLFEVENVTAQVAKCDHHIADPIVQIVSREKDIIVVPKWPYNEQLEANRAVDDVPTDISIDTHLESVLETSFDQSNSLEQTRFIDDNFVEREIYEESQCAEDEKLSLTKKVSSKVSAESVSVEPAVVAIFESVEDVTAHTCGGVLLAPQWVLTAASCVGMLRNLYYNNQSWSNATAPSEYTIIANTTSPFSEGTVHNVTEIHLHPGPLEAAALQGASSTPGVKSTLALLRVAPPARVAPLHVATARVHSKSDVRVYGWMLRRRAPAQNGSEADMLRRTSFLAKTLSPRECKAVNVSMSMTCFFHERSEDDQADASELWMSSGGPVVSWSGASDVGAGQAVVVGVANSGQRLPAAAFPLAPHHSWISSMLNT